MDAVADLRNQLDFSREAEQYLAKKVERLRAERAALWCQIGQLWTILKHHKLTEEYESDEE
jgi:hypothetical protein